MSNWHWFNPDTTDPNLKGVDPGTISKLDVARQWTVDNDPAKKGTPMQITRGKCDLQHEMALGGGVSDSSHISGHGVDIALNDDFSLCLMVLGLGIAGFRRIGIYHDVTMRPTHLHVDDDPNLPPITMWLKIEQN